nr:cytochrome P450 [Tanacetum cinerariifolium]
MDPNTRTSCSQDIDTSSDFDSFYFELEKRILALIADDENEDKFDGSANSKLSTSMWMNRQSSTWEQQNESYFCSKHGNENPKPLAPIWPLNLWTNTSKGTGVFIPARTIGARKRTNRKVKDNNDNSKAQPDKVLMKKIVLNQSDLLVVPDTSCVVLAKANGPRSYATAVKDNNDNSKAQPDKVLMKKIVLNQSDLLVVPDTSCVVLAKVQHISKTFKVDERIMWVELDGLPLSAWTSNAFKKVAGIWGDPLFVDAGQNESLANGRVCIKTKIHESIYDVCSVSINNERYCVRVKEFACWVLDYDTIDDSSKKDWASNNTYSDEDEHSIHMNDVENDVEEEGELKDNNIDEENINMQSDDEVKDTERHHTNDSKTVIKPTWDEEINNLEEQNEVFEKDDKVNNDQETCDTPSKPPGFEGIMFSTSTFNHGKKRSGAYSANSHFNVKSYWNGRSGGLLSIWDPSVFITASILSMENLLIVADPLLKGLDFYLTTTRLLSNGEKLSRLDRILVSEDVMNIVLNLMAISIDRLISDHRPIILKQSNIDFGSIPFKLYNSWLSISKFDNMITKAWDQSHGISGPNDMLLRDIEHVESLDAYQKAKIKWGMEADENTKFFHGIINKNRRGLAIKGLNMLIIKEWNPIIEKFKRRLSKWKANMLSIGGRIVKAINGMHDKGIIPHSSIKHHVKDGFATRFWRDAWLDDIPLERQFPLNATLTESQDTWQWNLIGSNIFNVKDIQLYIDFISLLESPTKTRWCRFIQYFGLVYLKRSNSYKVESKQERFR